MTHHSPFPWQWTPKSGVDGQTVLWAGYDMIVLSSNATLLAADASLIAAAPDLLRACEFAVNTIENTDMSDNEYAHCLVSVCDKCIAAITKAKRE